MRQIHELIETAEPAWPILQEWRSRAVRPIELLPPSEVREEVLVRTQVTTRSSLGSVVYETGGVLIDQGWLRVLGSGHPRLTRTLPGWNEGRGEGFLLVADDVVGGFFAINGGALGEDVKNMYYFAPDSLDWLPLNIGYSAFLEWACVGKLDLFYQNLRWTGWETDVSKLHGDRCYFFYPMLFTREGKDLSGRRGDVPVEESWGMQMELRQKLDRAPEKD